jgi:hypothetical protein
LLSKFKLITFILSLLVIVSIFVYRLTHNTKNNTFVENFESGEITHKCSGNCPLTSSEYANSGKYSMKVHLDRNQSKINYRTEIQESSFAAYGQDYWYEFSVYLPETYIPDDTWEIIAQWHAVPDFHLGETWRNPALSLQTTNGTWGVRSIWDTKDNTFESGKRVYSGSKMWLLDNYKLNEWTTWKFHIIWSYLDDGIIEVWKNGKQVISKKGPNCFNDNIGPYFKIGIYKGWKNNSTPSKINQRTLYFDDITITK